MAHSNNVDPHEKTLFIPKLRRNKKLEDKFGENYFTALKQAIFTPFDDPFIPSDPPELLQNENLLNYFRCKQCNDCFRFKSTFEEHKSRRSWILGYWCNACYAPPCKHKVSNQSCEACLSLEEKKRWYLVTRGLRKGQRCGMIKIFYNQCKFFEHLESHETRVVDCSDLMLMPFPSAIEKSEYSKLDQVSAPLFERMFLLKSHVVDWLKSRDIYDTWWKIADNENSPIQFVTKGYKNEQHFQKISKSLQNGNNGLVDENKRISPIFIDLENNEEMHEEEEEEERSDDPCPPVDIAFVDCGPTPNTFISKPTRTATPNESVKTSTSSFTPKISVKKFANDLNWTSEKSTTKVTSNSKLKSINITPNLIPISPTSGAILQTPKLNADTKILTVRGPKGVNLNTLIKQLPHDVINNKRIVFVGQQTDKPAGLNLPANPNATTYKSIMPVLADSKKPQFIRILPNPTKPTTTLVQSVPTPPKLVETRVNGSPETSNAFVYKNGKKFLMKQKIVKSKLLLNSSAKGMKNLGKIRTLTTTPTLVTIQPTDSLVVTCLEKDFTGEQLRVCEDQNKNPVLKSIARSKSSNTQSTVFRYRQNMLTHLPLMAPSELSLRIEHFRKLVNRCRQILNMENLLVGHMSMINILNKAQEKAKEVSSVPDELVTCDVDYDNFLNKWEMGLHYVEQKRCHTCNKIIKPDSYVFGLSQESKNPTRYCTCGEFICYMCNLYQGNSSRFQAHLEYHDKKDSFICPECFQKYNSYKELAVHVWTCCFHTLTRRMLGCNVCQIGGFENPEALARHFALMHATKKVCCSRCSRIFRTHEECREHQKKEHLDTSGLTIMKILICDVGECVIDPKLFRAHMTSHIGTQKLLYYKCPICNAFIKDTGRGKEVIKLHLYSYHMSNLPTIFEKDVLADIMASGVPEAVRKYESQNKLLKKKFDPKIVKACTIPPELFDNTDEQSDQSSDQANNDIEPDQNKSSHRNSPLPPKKTYSKKPITVILSDSSPSPEKSKSENKIREETTPVSKKTKIKPNRIALNGPSADSAQDYKCHLCGDLINTSWSVVRDHFSTKHSDTYELSILSPTLLRISNEFIERGYQEYVAKKRKAENSISPAKRRKRWTPKKQVENAGNEKLSGMCVMPETAQDNNGHFVCKKCEKQCDNADNLRRHIAASHRIKDMYLICLECGENFIVAPSLQMHLKAFHGVDDPITYLEQNPLYAAEIVDDLEEKMKAVVSNQCHVCMAVFEDKAAVDKHFRVHGMAFLNRKRIEARKAIKSPEADKMENEQDEEISVETVEFKEEKEKDTTESKDVEEKETDEKNDENKN